MTKPHPHNCTSQETASVLAGIGIDARIVLTTGEVIFAKVVAMLDRDDTFDVRPWGCDETRRLRRAEVRRAAPARVSWMQMRRITREQRERYA